MKGIGLRSKAKKKKWNIYPIFQNSLRDHSEINKPKEISNCLGALSCKDLYCTSRMFTPIPNIPSTHKYYQIKTLIALFLFHISSRLEFHSPPPHPLVIGCVLCIVYMLRWCALCAVECKPFAQGLYSSTVYHLFCIKCSRHCWQLDSLLTCNFFSFSSFNCPNREQVWTYAPLWASELA